MERIRPPYRPDDDIPFKARHWRLLAATFVITLSFVALVGIVIWLRYVFRGMGDVLIYLIILLVVLLTPLAYMIWHYLTRRKDSH
jgi:Na+-driven multidrug efflux pump